MINVNTFAAVARKAFVASTGVVRRASVGTSGKHTAPSMVSGAVVNHIALNAITSIPHIAFTCMHGGADRLAARLHRACALHFAIVDGAAKLAITRVALLAAAYVVVETSCLANGMYVAIIDVIVKARVYLCACFAIARETFIARACVFCRIASLQSNSLGGRMEVPIVDHEIHITAFCIDRTGLSLNRRPTIVNGHALLAIALEMFIACALVSARPSPAALGIEAASTIGGQRTWVNRCAITASSSVPWFANAIIE